MRCGIDRNELGLPEGEIGGAAGMGKMGEAAEGVVWGSEVDQAG